MAKSKFNSPEGNLEDYFITEYELIDQWIGDTLWTWGNGTFGRLGNNDTTNRLIPVTTFAGGTNWKQVSSRGSHTAAIKTDGTLWTWGAGANGKLGNNDTTDRSTPVTTFIGGNDWKQVSAGANHTAAIKTNGTLWTWGTGAAGRLGTNDETNRLTPVTTFAGGTDWKQVSGGTQHNAAIKTDGTLWTWGANYSAQLGTNDTTQRNTPVITFAGGTNWKSVACGGYYVSAIKTDGTLWGWGNGGSGRLATNDEATRSTPVTTFVGGTNWKSVSCGRFHTLAIKTDGTLWGWGVGAGGKLGNNDGANKLTPITTFAGGTNWKQVSCIDDFTAAVKTDGTLWVWGSNTNGRLGTNDTTQRNTPVTTFAGGTDWKQVSCGFLHTAAVTIGVSANLPLS